MSNQLTILEKQILQIDNLYNLNLVHQANGELRKHQPSNFLRLDTTQELIAEIESDGQTQAVKVYRGSQGGTYVCEELVLSYAMWISPKFHLIVLRAFLAMHRNQPQQLSLPEPEKKYTFEFTEYELQTVAWACFAFRRNNNLLHELYSPLAAIGSKFAVEARDNAVEYRNTLRRFNEVVKRITVDIEADPETNWRVLKHIRSFDEKIFGKVETTI
ncbi:bacteriocin [Haemophilus haemolyticus]|uniref:Bacteriocin n=1 Tax=Haemophilus haemolyticus TaxID=726 RepID=A0A502LEW1_HAEHA|nr:P22AR C-terminal domain-containing protein [Haemophilus haemolyticus]TPH22740.1 bacteriocin [Haemophilus haemolyticus]